MLEVSALTKADINNMAASAKEHRLSMLKAAAHKVLKRRIEHCYESLQIGIDCDRFHDVSDGCYCFDGGHFNLSTYNKMVEAYQNIQSTWSAMVWMQIIKQLYYERNTSSELFEFACDHLAMGMYKNPSDY